MPVDAPPLEPPFVGRDAELRTLTAAFERAGAAQGVLVAIAGAAGIGKTRLVEEMVEHVALPPARVAWGRCLEQTCSPSYWPWMRALRTYAEARGLAALREEIGADAEIFGAFVPELLPAGAAVPPGIASGDVEARYRLFEAWARFVRRWAASPLIVVLEDAHWADEASLALLEFVAGELDGTHLLLVVTYREREERRLPRALAEAVRRGTCLTLGGLDDAAVGAMVTRLATTPASATVVERLTRATGGNPFFLREVLRTLARDRRLDHALAETAKVPLPDTVRDSIRHHLDRFAPDERDLLAVAAVVGDECELPTLELATASDAPAVLKRLETALVHGLIVERQAGTFAFAHALVRETIYADLPPATRVRLHASVGAALERRHRDPATTPWGTLAGHFLGAAPLGTGAKAVDYAMRAGREAMAVHAYDDALAAYEQALAARRLDAGETSDRLRLHLAAAEAARCGGHDPRARELYRLAAHDARSRGDRDALFRAAIGYYRVTPQEAEPDPDTVGLLAHALAALDPSDSAERATVLALLAVAREVAERGTRGHDAQSAEAVAMARRVGKPRALATALIVHEYLLAGPDTTTERLRIAEEVLGLAERGVHDVVQAARLIRTHCFLERGDTAAAAEEILQSVREADRLRLPQRQWRAGVQRAAIALLQGRFEEGARLAADSLATRRSGSDPMAFPVFVIQMFAAARDPGREGGLEGSLRWVVERYPHLQAWRVALALFLAERGRVDEARRLYEGLVVDDFATLARGHEYATVLAWLAQTGALLEDRRRADRLYALLLPYADHALVLSIYSRLCVGSAHRYLGLAAATAGRLADAARHFEAAIAMNERMGARPFVAACEHELARVLLVRDAGGDRARARELVERARATADACAMTDLSLALDALAESNAHAPVPASPAPDRTTRTTDVATAAGTNLAILRRDGNDWLVGFAGETIALRDVKGIHLLETLLRHPGQEIHALDLDGEGAAPAGGAAVQDDVGPALEPAARAAYKRRLEDLRDELDEAERFNDTERAARARHEIDFLAEEVARGVGLGGRDRRAAAAAERARVNVTRALAKVLRRIGTSLPRLGEHLRATIRTGYLCVYAPDPTSPIRWKLTPPE